MVISLDNVIYSTILVGISYGGVFTIYPILVGEYFGLKNFASNW
jgi:hypothetical protein